MYLCRCFRSASLRTLFVGIIVIYSMNFDSNAWIFNKLCYFLFGFFLLLSIAFNLIRCIWKECDTLFISSEFTARLQHVWVCVDCALCNGSRLIKIWSNVNNLGLILDLHSIHINLGWLSTFENGRRNMAHQLLILFKSQIVNGEDQQHQFVVCFFVWSKWPFFSVPTKQATTKNTAHICT